MSEGSILTERVITRKPPSILDALQIHLKRAVYQASFCWAQSLSKDAVLPDTNEWGWKTCDDGYDLFWTTIPEASKMCQELIRSCGCKSKKGCKGPYKRVKPSL